jgi:hypothetical protein
MKKIAVVLMIVLVSCPTALFAQDLGAWNASPLGSLMEHVKVNPYVQVGFQWLGANLNLPVQNDLFQAIPLEIEELDVSLEDANFWTGIVGVNVIANEKYSFFAAAGGFVKRPFVTAGRFPVNVGGVSGVPFLEFTNSNLESWFAQTGIGLRPFLVGLYWNQFSFELTEPRSRRGPIENQTLRGDFIAKTFPPFVGFAIPASGATFTLLYSPLAYSDTDLALRSSRDTSAELRYSWNKPGDLLIALLQYNTPLTSAISTGLWVNGSWLSLRGNGQLEFQNISPPISRNKDVTITMTQYVLGGGVTLGITF